MDQNPYDLFRIHHRSDGSLPLGQRVKISIRGLSKQANDNSYGTFSLDVRDESDTDGQQVVLESFNGLSMDPNSDRFFARIIGDKNIFFDFDQGTSSQRLVVDGDYDNRSKYIRVEQSNAIKGGQVPNSALPFGYRGPSHLVTSGSDTLTTLSGDTLRCVKRSEPPPGYSRKNNLSLTSECSSPASNSI